MEIYTLDDYFHKKDVIDQEDSIIWTERYNKAGDVTLLVPPTKALIGELTEGTFLSIDESKEVMLIETALVQGGQLKVTGNTLAKFLDNRVFHVQGVYDPKYLAYTGMTPSQVISDMVQRTVMASHIHRSPAGAEMVDGDAQIINGLVAGAVDFSGSPVDMQVQFGPLYSAIEAIADTYKVGFSLYLDSVNPTLGTDFTLKFTTYLGRDLTSAQSVNPVVKFSPNLDSLGNLSELRSIANYKNVAIVYAPPETAGFTGQIVVETDPNNPAPTQFDRRTILIQDDELTVEKVGSTAAITTLMHQKAKDALANNNYTKVVDGEVVPQSQFTYGVDYTLGDIVELASPSGLATKARVTEYIRTKDNTGKRAYPTVSVTD